MKNQYFGDTRDLFKYDLIIHLLKSLEPKMRLTFIPMLTENDHKTHGNIINYKHAKAGHNNKVLARFLQDCVRLKRRNIIELERLFKKIGLLLTICCKDKYFSDMNRESYFRNIKSRSLCDSLIFVDPDNGFEVKHMQKPSKYIFYKETGELFHRMNSGSILMVYQHIPRKNRILYFGYISEKLKNITGAYPLYISDNQIVFFFLYKTKQIGPKLSSALKRYRNEYNTLKYLFYEGGPSW